MERRMVDLIILGGGCAGLTAGIYAGRAGLRTLILEGGAVGGQAATTGEIGNYPGVPDADGPSLMERMLAQARDYGADFEPCTVKAVALREDIKRVETSAGEFAAHAVIIATGATPRKLGFEGEDDFRGKGVGYCATCDGFFFKDKDILVVGGGNSAAEEALYLTRFARRVILLVRRGEFRCERTLAQRVTRHPKIEVRFHTELVRAFGNERLRGAELRNNQTGETTLYTPPEEDGTFGIFVFVGHQPATELFKGQVALDEAGYVKTNDAMETNLPGVYAAGDVRPKALRQLVTATADGAIAANRAGEYILRRKEQMGIAHDEARHAPTEGKAAKAAGGVLTEEMRGKLRPVFARLERDIRLVMAGDPAEAKTRELKALLEEVCAQSPHLSLEVYGKDDPACPVRFERWPGLAVCGADGAFTGVRFSGVPGGHEFNSLILAIYNAAGPGQELERDVRERVKAIDRPLRMEVAVSLSCHFCPEVVSDAHRLALLNPRVEAEMVDVGLFPEVRREHGLMSVPALIINGQVMRFGALSMAQIADAMAEAPRA